MNENGLISFLTEIPSFFNVQFPLEYPLVAALYSDVDCRSGGTVWYRASTDPALLRKAADKVKAAFQVVAFAPTEAFVATWDKVGHFERKSEKVRTVHFGTFSFTISLACYCL